MTNIRYLLFAALAFGIAAIIATNGGSAQAMQAQLDRHVLPGNAVYPEGIAYEASTGDFYVSSTTDGAIYKGNIARPEAELWLPGATEGLTGTRGLKVDNEGRLYAAGGPQGTIHIFNVANKQLISKLATGVQNSFVNDISIAPDRAAYATDSNVPNIYKVSETTQGQFTLEKWLDVSPTVVYTTGFNLGGIDINDDGRYMVVAQGNTGKLFRVDMASKAISEITLSGGEPVVGADGIWIDGQTLYVIRNNARLLVTITMSGDFGSGSVVSSATDPSFAFPTTLAKAGNRLLVVNSQFDKRSSGAPVLPFTVSNIAAPQSAAQPQPTTTTAAATPAPVGTPVPAETVEPTPMPAGTPVTPGMPSTGAGTFDIAALGAMLAVAMLLVGGLSVRRARQNS